MSQELSATIRIDVGHNARALGSNRVFDCPVIKLVSYVFEAYPRNAFEILRRPISLNAVPGPEALSVIQVLAKRWTLDPQSEFTLIPEVCLKPVLNDDQIEFQERYLGKRFPTDPLAQAGLLMQAEALVTTASKRHQSSRPIATFITNQENRILSIGWNLRSHNPVWHAELVAVHGLTSLVWIESPGATVKVFTSLQPCRMCASYLIRLAVELGAQLDVFYLRPDDGPKAKNTGLEACQRPLVSD